MAMVLVLYEYVERIINEYEDYENPIGPLGNMQIKKGSGKLLYFGMMNYVMIQK